MTPSPTPPPRVASLDAYRGFVMLLMLAEVLRLSRVAKAVPDSPVWQFLAFHQSHVEWRGLSLHDLIQPSFSFLVGAALAFSLAARRLAGQSTRRILLHAGGRAVVLVLLGVFLRSVGKKQTNWTFEDTLSQIGLGYLPLVLIALAKPAWRYVALGVILVGYWAAFALYTPPAGLTPADTGVPENWPHHTTGFAAHWDKNVNLAWDADRSLLNQFPREKPFLFNGGGYSTLSFVPTLGTMLLGLIAGGWLKTGASWLLVGRLVVAGAVCLGVGLVLDYFGVCPSVKRIWTPSWVLVSGGWCLLILAGFVKVCDVLGYVAWAYPLRVIGANSIVAYCSEHLFAGFLRDSFRTHFGKDVFQAFGDQYESLAEGAAVLAVLWLMLWFLYRRRVFVRL